MLGDKRNYMKIVISTLIHHNLLSWDHFEGSLVEIEDLLEQLPIEKVDQIELPIPDVIILIGK